MRAQPAARGGFLAAALARAEAWLLEPAEPTAPEGGSTLTPPRRPIVAVFGLGRGCGASVVSRALAAELAARDPEGAAAVSCAASQGGIGVARPAAARLARALSDVPGAAPRAAGRLCLVAGAELAALADTAPHFAPLVLDAGGTAVGGVAAAVADRVVLVAAPRVEPALADAAGACLARVGADPICVLNRAREDEPWRSRASVFVPESRLGAQLALAGREPRGLFGEAIAELADLSEVGR